MADNTQILNPSSNVPGDTIRTEDLGTSKAIAAKIHLGGAGADTGPVTSSNGLPINSGGDVVASVTSGQTAVGTSAVALKPTSVPATRVVAVKAFNENTANVFVGASGVTTTSGWQLGPGESLMLAINDAMNVYVVAAPSTPQVNQNVSWIVL